MAISPGLFFVCFVLFHWFSLLLTWLSLTSFCHLPGPNRHSNLKFLHFIVMGLNSSWGNEWLFSPGMASVYLLVYLNDFLHMVELCQWIREKGDAMLVTLLHLQVKQLGLIISQSCHHNRVVCILTKKKKKKNNYSEKRKSLFTYQSGGRDYFQRACHSLQDHRQE